MRFLAAAFGANCHPGSSRWSTWANTRLKGTFIVWLSVWLLSMIG